MNERPLTSKLANDLRYRKGEEGTGLLVREVGGKRVRVGREDVKGTTDGFQGRDRPKPTAARRHSIFCGLDSNLDPLSTEYISGLDHPQELIIGLKLRELHA
jgi:hypothetical protein